jgi:hypothetical protein
VLQRSRNRKQNPVDGLDGIDFEARRTNLARPESQRTRCQRGAKTMKIFFVLAAISLSTHAFAQSVPASKLAQAKPKEPMGCKLVGTVKGTKLWAGDCTSSNDLRGPVPVETQPLTERATGVIPPGQTQ